MAMAYKQAKKMKQSKKLAPYEIYLKMPGEVQEAEIETQICIPLHDPAGQIAFAVLSDVKYAVSRQFGVIYEVPRGVTEAMKTRGLDFKGYYGTETAELPPAGTIQVVSGLPSVSSLRRPCAASATQTVPSGPQRPP